eukprot:3480464-Heterocapsa_arctica.AAC.1
MGPWCSPLPLAPVPKLALLPPVVLRPLFPGLGSAGRVCAPFSGSACARDSRTRVPPAPLRLLPPP